jgi:hypothetical protein
MKTIRCPVCNGSGKVSAIFFPDNIKRITTEHFDMTLPASMREAKQVSIYLCRDHTGMTLQQIAEAFDRTYEDAIHACKVVSDRMRSEPEFRERVGRVFHQLACVKRQEGFFSGVESPELSTPEFYE